ncbi:ADP-ribosylation factor 1 [Hypsizygus marmoreus]|uniref:ADP-ribosylation factor 1 n=1 Tax=Hypsizygus marmoreus TaxID=39966 RepID=A0A369J6M5_HYPMA|nr:ADP-ribosylation factor 1 [Hypsizygus marmoreus]
MSTIVRRLVDRLYPRDSNPVITIFGVGWSGKTTLLYLLKFGEVVQTISSFGFNVETVEAPTSSGRPFKFDGWDVGTGCANIKMAFGHFSEYIARGDALIWMVDGSAPDFLSESVEALEHILIGVDARRFLSDKLMKDYPILILANKKDLPNSIPIDNIRKAFAKALQGRTAMIFATTLTQGIETSGLPEAFDWFRFAIDFASSRKATRPNVLTMIPDQRSSSQLKDKLDSWLMRAETDANPQDFIAQFHSLTLPAWDHYTHVRIAFVLLTAYGRQKGKDMIFDDIEKYIAESTQTQGRTFHVTMTYFWIQIVHLGIRNISPSTDLKSTSSSSTTTTPASPDQFPLFLLLNPYVADGNLWADYYTKDVMMTPKAKAEMVLPDKKPLPNLVFRDAI